MMESKLHTHFRSWEVVEPINLKVSTADIILLNMVMDGSFRGFLLKSTVISTVLSMFMFSMFRVGDFWVDGVEC